jgi:hypothetical protein
LGQGKAAIGGQVGGDVQGGKLLGGAGQLVAGAGGRQIISVSTPVGMQKL